MMNDQDERVGDTAQRASRSTVVFRVLGVLAIPAAIAALLFGTSYAARSEPDVEISPVPAAGVVDDREVVFVSYNRTGTDAFYGGLSWPETRLAAVAADDGDLIWDVQVIDWSVDSGVLAAGADYVYVPTDDGLYILASADGSVVAEPDAIDGLDHLVAAYGAYAFDSQEEAVVVLDAQGSILEIPLDSLEARPADQAATQRWTGVLSAEPAAFTDYYDEYDDPRYYGAQEDMIVFADGSTLAVGSSGLSLTSADGRVGDVGPATFGDDALFVYATELSAEGLSGVPAGLTQGFVLVQNELPDETWYDTHQLTVVDTRTGDVTAMMRTGSSVRRAVTLTEGRTAVIAASGERPNEDVLIILDESGALDVTRIGATDFFGFPV